MVVGHADWSIHAAEEELQIWRTLDLNQRPELVNFQTRFLLKRHTADKIISILDNEIPQSTLTVYEFGQIF